MHKERISFYSVGNRSHLIINTDEEEKKSLFDRLPFFEPWVWKFFIPAFAVGFSIGWGITEYIKYSLMK